MTMMTGQQHVSRVMTHPRLVMVGAIRILGTMTPAAVAMQMLAATILVVGAVPTFERGSTKCNPV
jgi:hypothetical protein